MCVDGGMNEIIRVVLLEVMHSRGDRAVDVDGRPNRYRPCVVRGDFGKQQRVSAMSKASPPAINVSTAPSDVPSSPGGTPQLIGKAHKLLWKQDIDLDVEVYKLQPKFGNMYCVHSVNVETAHVYPKLYVAHESFAHIVKSRKENNNKMEEHALIVDILTNGLEVTAEEKVKLPGGIHAGETLELGSPKVRSKKRATVTDFKNSQQALVADTKLLSLASLSAAKKQMLIKFAIRAFDNKIDYHDSTPKGRWHRAYRKVMFRLTKAKVMERLHERAHHK